MHCAICTRKVSARWTAKTPRGRLCPRCEKQHYFRFQFGSRKHLPICEVIIDLLPPGVKPDEKIERPDDA